MKSIVKASELEKILENIFNENKNKRIVVIGTTCSGKSTIVKKLAYLLEERCSANMKKCKLIA